MGFEEGFMSDYCKGRGFRLEVCGLWLGSEIKHHYFFSFPCNSNFCVNRFKPIIISIYIRIHYVYKNLKGKNSASRWNIK
ncbi:MAG: hypothetical protein MZV64_31905 [Ignavibacteriales bacterium]|nr:hypothetical protein [Ignavibacteriales bacterium]